MNSRRQLLENVIEDRRKGTSLSALSRKYQLAKSTVSLWCKGLQISPQAKFLIKEKWLQSTSMGRIKGTQRNKQKRADSIEYELKKAREMLGELNERDLLIMGVGLYWAEGSKKEVGSGFSFINSDPSMIVIIYKWLTQIAFIKKDQLLVNLSVNESQRAREQDILKFWSNLLDLPIERFGNTVFIKTLQKRRYNNQATYFGMLRIKVKSSAWLRRRILGMIKVFIDKMPA